MAFRDSLKYVKKIFISFFAETRTVYLKEARGAALLPLKEAAEQPRYS